MIFGLLMATAGLALIIVGQRMFWIRQFARLRGQVIQGKIERWKAVRAKIGPRSKSATSFMHYPVVIFTDPNGIERTVEIGYQYTRQFVYENPKGSPLPVLFDPMHPDRTLDSTWTMSYFLPVLLNFCGGLVLLIGLGIFLSCLNGVPEQVNVEKAEARISHKTHQRVEGSC